MLFPSRGYLPLLDFTSLLLAAGLSGICIGLTMIGLWLPMRQENFLVTWAIGVFLLVGHVFAYWRYVLEPHFIMGMLVVVLLPLGFSFIYAAAERFFSKDHPRKHVLVACTISILLTAPAMAAGYDGIALIGQNFVSTALLFISGAVYWRHRRQAPAVLGVLTGLYVLCGLSFLSCGAVILFDQAWVIGYAPDNWAERANTVISICCLTVVAALSLSLNQILLTNRHRADSLTDPLTRLLNRRALFTLFENKRLSASDAVAMFDLDNFKPINDVYGHAMGDEVIARFAAVVRAHTNSRQTAVRLGGEEFALVMRDITRDGARTIVERIATSFAADAVETPNGRLGCTVSAGIGFGRPEGALLDEVIRRADAALYAAKRGGRNRVETERFRLAG